MGIRGAHDMAAAVAEQSAYGHSNVGCVYWKRIGKHVIGVIRNTTTSAALPL